MVNVRATHLKALDCGARFFAKYAGQYEAMLQCCVKIHQRAVVSFINVLGPERTIEMNPFVNVKVEKTSGPVGCTVTLTLAEHTAATVLRFSGRYRTSHTKQHLNGSSINVDDLFLFIVFS